MVEWNKEKVVYAFLFINEGIQGGMMAKTANAELTLVPCLDVTHTETLAFAGLKRLIKSQTLCDSYSAQTGFPSPKEITFPPCW